jgi:hypothetical protein
MTDHMKVWVGEKEVGSVGTDGSIFDAAGRMIGHIYLYSGEVSMGDAIAGDKVVGSVSHEGDIYDDTGKVGDIARSGNIWDLKGRKAGSVVPLRFWESAIALYESHDAPVLLAGGAALLLVLKQHALPTYQMYQYPLPQSSHIHRTRPGLG